MRNRKNAVLVRFYDDEIALLDSKARRAGIAREQFIREAVSNKKIHEVPSADYLKFIYELRRVGQNLNRLLQIAYSNGLLDVASINHCLDEIRSLDRNIHKEFFGEKTEYVTAEHGITAK